MKKRGQIHLSFGMIFSILLIIVFIAFAIYAVMQFLSLQNSIKISNFYNSLQNDVNTAWNSENSNKAVSYDLPSYIKEVCFTNTQDNNLVVYDNNDRPVSSQGISNINVTAMTLQGDKCFNITNSKLSFSLQKNFGDTLVIIR